MNSDDVDAIKQVVAALERAQQHERPDDFLSLFRPDAVWVTAHGKHMIGLAEISEFTHKVLPGAMKDSTATYEVANIVFVRPDVAVVNVHQRPVTLDGTPLAGAPEGRPTYVMAKDESVWKIAAGQNTQVKEP